MKKVLNGAVLLFAVLSIPALGGLILALLDIRHQYISPKQIQALALNPSDLPSWAFSRVEWVAVGAAVLILGLFAVLFIANAIIRSKSSNQ